MKVDPKGPIAPHIASHLNETQTVNFLRELRAIARWQAFIDRLTSADRVMLDRLACGDAIKAAAHAAGLNYAAAQKRLTRLAEALKLHSVEQLTSVWRKTNRGRAEIENDLPTVIAYSDRLRDACQPKAAE